MCVDFVLHTLAWITGNDQEIVLSGVFFRLRYRVNGFRAIPGFHPLALEDPNFLCAVAFHLGAQVDSFLFPATAGSILFSRIDSPGDSLAMTFHCEDPDGFEQMMTEILKGCGIKIGQPDPKMLVQV